MVRKTPPGLSIRVATAADAAILHDMVCQLASYERLQDSNHSSVESLRAELSRPDTLLHGVVAEVDGRPAGMATYFQTYSTFAARRGMYLEDIYVTEQFRHLGVGTAILYFLAKLAVERDYGRIEWTTLLWNTPAIEFYETLGATPNDAWTTYRLSGEWLKRLAAIADGAMPPQHQQAR